VVAGFPEHADVRVAHLTALARNLSSETYGSVRLGIILAACTRIIEQIEEAERAAAGEYSAPKGALVVTAPIVLGRLYLLPVATEFLRAYPEINLGCCMTPLANTSRYAWMPFVGAMSCALDSEDEALLGPARHVNESHATPWGTMRRSAKSLLLGFLLRRSRPNPFFAENGKPLSRPERPR
ncbi:MAG TPA: hypothetical protein VGF76_20325, partial [Polyangiaceae bacterium]